MTASVLYTLCIPDKDIFMEVNNSSLLNTSNLVKSLVVSMFLAE